MISNISISCCYFCSIAASSKWPTPHTLLEHLGEWQRNVKNIIPTIHAHTHSNSDHYILGHVNHFSNAISHLCNVFCGAGKLAQAPNHSSVGPWNGRGIERRTLIIFISFLFLGSVPFAMLRECGAMEVRHKQKWWKSRAMKMNEFLETYIYIINVDDAGHFISACNCAHLHWPKWWIRVTGDATRRVRLARYVLLYDAREHGTFQWLKWASGFGDS